jgi:hypothetical protein
MESQFMRIRQDKCTPENGYGANRAPNAWLDLWAKLYEIDHFPTYQEAQEDKAGASKYLPLQIRGYGFLNIPVYKKRIRMTIEPFLLDANARAQEEKKSAYLHIVGLGLGVWMVNEKQGQMMVEVYADVFRERQLTHISDIDFSYFPADCVEMGGVRNGGSFEEGPNKVTVHFSRRNPAERLSDPGKLLVAMYPWDGNSFPGNEYWRVQLTASGDPAAASCSMISELQNPMINPFCVGQNRWTGE